MATASTAPLWIVYRFNVPAGRIQYLSKMTGKDPKDWVYTSDVREAARLPDAGRAKFHAQMKRNGFTGFETPVVAKKVEKIAVRSITDYLTKPEKAGSRVRSFAPSAQILGANAGKVKEHALQLQASGIGACRVIRETVKAFPGESNGLIKHVLCDGLKLNSGTVNRQMALERKEQGK